MHIPKSSAAALPSTLLPLLLLLPGSSLGVTASIADRSACIRSGAVKLSQAAACGDKGSLEYCFKHVGEYVEASDLERCFRNAGCTSAEAGIEAAFIIHNCENPKSDSELRRRGPEPIPAPTPAPRPEDTTSTTTDDNGGYTATIQCSTSTDISTTTCPVQSTGTQSGQTLSCFSTTIATSVCAAENLCQTDSNGIDICMRRQDVPDTGGLVVTIFLGVCFAVGFGLLLFYACRSKAAERKRHARTQAAAIAKTNAAMASSDMAAGPTEETPFNKRDHSPSPSPLRAQHGQNPFEDGPRY